MNRQPASSLKKYLSLPTVWALGFGCSVGWGAFVMPGNTFLPIAGPMGTLIGMVLGAVVMFIIGINYYYMMTCYPDAGGTFTYTKRTFGYDHGFLSAWFLSLTYIAIIWANVTALALVGRNILGRVFQFGFHYTLAGYDIYLGEVLVEITALVAFGLLCMFRKKLAGGVQLLMALLLFGGIIYCFFRVSAGSGAVMAQPLFHPDTDRFAQVFNIIALTPWAFIGFESISHSTEEFRFPVKKSFGILAVTVIIVAAAYILLNTVAAMLQPEGYTDWHTYVSDLDARSGVEALPVFYAVHRVLGQNGIRLLGFVLFAGIVTGIIGNYIAASRLLYALAEDDILPRWFGKTDKDATPRNAIAFIMLISLVIPFFGRTAIGWIVDVTTIGATIAYGYTSAAAFRKAKESGKMGVQITGIIGVVMSVVFVLYLLVPNLWTVSSLAAESYLILAFWGIMGFLFFRMVFQKDEGRRFGRSTIVWIAMLFLIFFTSLMWMRRTTHLATERVIGDISDYYMDELAENGLAWDSQWLAEEKAFVNSEMEQVQSSLLVNSLIQMLMIVVGIAVIFNVYNMMQVREKKMELERQQALESSRAKSAFLSNMSHDIRTPLNAIIGYINLSRGEEVSLEEIRAYQAKIEGSSQHLLALINDVLEMSRIESGKMDLEEVPVDLKRLLHGVEDMFATQMQEKGVRYTVDTDGVKNTAVYCDKNRLNRMLLNLISNAYKFTPEGGTVSVILRENGEPEDGKAAYELRVKDSGIGMSEEFAAKVFEAFERERTSTVSGIQGTGLGMAITRSIVDLMGGEITVNTAPDRGTEFVVNVRFRLCEEEITEEGEEELLGEAPEKEIDFSQMRLLLVEDMDINREIATMLLTNLGFAVEQAVNGKEAVEKVTEAEPGYYDAVLMDIQMPVMDGYTATRTIRALTDEKRNRIPIIAMTANAFAEDVQKAHEAGMDAHIAKPIDVNIMVETLKEILG